MGRKARKKEKEKERIERREERVVQDAREESPGAISAGISARRFTGSLFPRASQRTEART